jgi:hypothetical protein
VQLISGNGMSFQVWEDDIIKIGHWKHLFNIGKT